MKSTDDFSKAVDITKQLGTHAKRMVKPKDIPIYGQEETVKEVNNVNETGTLLPIVKEGRLAVQNAYNQAEEVISPIKASAINIIETGKAHAQATYQMIRDEQDSTVNAAVIGGSGLLGFMLASFSKRARLFKRILFTSASAGAASYVIYPSETEAISNSLVEETTRLGLIAYNFIQGPQPSGSANKLTASGSASHSMNEEVAPNSDLGQGNPADKDMYTTRGS